MIKPIDDEALARVRHYVAMRDAQPIRDLDDCIHRIHTRTEWEAALNLSDLRAVLAGLAPKSGPRPLAVGDWVVDNDPRQRKDRWKVVRIEDDCAALEVDGPYGTIISLSRIHLDGKPRRSGWSRVEGPGARCETS